jgi:hypothetical protein
MPHHCRLATVTPAKAGVQLVIAWIPACAVIIILRCLLDRPAWLPGGETDTRPHLQDSPARNTHRTGFYTARFRNISRTATVDRDGRCIARFAVIRRHCRRLPESLPARLDVGSSAQDYVAAWDFVRMKPPIIGLSQLRG